MSIQGASGKFRERSFLTVTNRLRTMAFVCAASAFLLGMAAIVSVIDTKIMPYNSALCFVITAIGLILSLLGRKEGCYLVLPVVVLSSLVFIQYVTNINMGIDRMFVGPALIKQNSDPGRMALNTAILFMVVAAAQIILRYARSDDLRLYVTTALCTCVVIFSASVLAGYMLIPRQSYGWWSQTNMALGSALGFLFTGISIGCFAMNQAKKSGMVQQLARPMMAVVTVTLVMIFLVQVILLRDEKRINDLASFSSQEVARSFEKKVDDDVKTLLRMRDRVKNNLSQDLSNWHHDAKNYVQDVGGFRAVALTDGAGTLRALEPENARQDFIKIPHSWRPYEVKPDKGRVFVSPFIYDSEDNILVFIRLPLDDADGKNVGAIICLYDLGQIFGGLYRKQYNETFTWVEIKSGDKNLFSNAIQAVPDRNISSQAPVRIFNNDWTISVYLDPARYESITLPLLIFIVGFAMALSLGAAIWQSARLGEYAKDIQESRKILQAVMDTAVDGLITIDQHGIVQSYNNACEKIFGYAREDVLGKNINILMPEPFHSGHDQYLKNYIGGAPAKVIGIGRQLEARRKNGETFPIELSVAEVKVGKERLFSGIVRDISERKLYEERLKETLKDLEYSNRELEQFAYVASHDLKAPLRGIDNLARWIEEDLSSVMTEDAREKIRLLQGRIKRLEVMLEDILSYSRAGRIVDEPRLVDLNIMVESIRESIVPESFSFQVSGLLPSVKAPYTPLQQILSNLISNAVKHHDRPQGTIRVAALDKGMFHELIVADDGPGIPPEFHERAFGMFQTLQSRDKKEGSGLGMAIIKKLVEWQGGQVWIVSAAGIRGTAVHFTWPKQSVSKGGIKNAA
jgi:two-component system, LuxR family, sensor kinase FixL